MATRIRDRSSAMRKGPRQARSRATIDAILDGAARILGQRGWKGFTTNAAAETAGVSIGSLYQYFPNKLALIEAVRQRHFDEVLAVLREAADPKKKRDRRIAALVDGMIAVHLRHPDAHRVLLEECPRGPESRDAHDAFEHGYRAAFEEIVRTNARCAVDTRICADVLASAIAGAVHEAARQGTLTSPAFRDEVIALSDSYMSKKRRPPSTTIFADELGGAAPWRGARDR